MLPAAFAILLMVALLELCSIRHPAMLSINMRTRTLTDNEKFLISLVNERAVEPVFSEPLLISDDHLLTIPAVLHEDAVKQDEASTLMIFCLLSTFDT